MRTVILQSNITLAIVLQCNWLHNPVIKRLAIQSWVKQQSCAEYQRPSSYNEFFELYQNLQALCWIDGSVNGFSVLSYFAITTVQWNFKATTSKKNLSLLLSHKACKVEKLFP